MREQLTAWAGDCVVRGSVDLGDGRLSDQVNDRDLLTFFSATLEALDDGHRVELEEVEVERRELHLIEARGRRGDPTRRLRTVEERVALQVGPFLVMGNLHRPPNTAPLAALARKTRFLPMTDAVIDVDGRTIRQQVILVNRDLISGTWPLAPVAMGPDVRPSDSAPRL
jgi:hypothetical protein